jgi:uncharacterized protein HemY
VFPQQHFLHHAVLQVLSDALSAAEGVSSEAHPRVACVLLELGRLYARTARVSYAEGLYRQACAKAASVQSAVLVKYQCQVGMACCTMKTLASVFSCP